MTSTDSIDVTILIPAYNEAQAIGGVIKSVQKVMDPLEQTCEILVIDDCSTDETARLAADAGARVIRHDTNQGSGAARRTGIRQARGEIIVMLDGDGTYEASTIAEMLRWLPEYDQVNGARTSEQGTLPLLRRPAKWFIRNLAIYLSGQKIPDLNTGLKAFKRSIMLRYLWMLPDGFSCVTTMTLAFLTNGYRVKYIATPYYKRIGQSKFHPVKDTVRYFTTVVRMCAFFKPMRVLFPIAAAFVGAAVIHGGTGLWNTEDVTPGGGTLALFGLGIFVGLVGLLLDVHVSQRREVVNNENGR